MSGPQEIAIQSTTGWGGWSSLEDHAHPLGFTVEVHEGHPALIPGPEMKFLYIASLTFTTVVEAHQFLCGFSMGHKFAMEIEGVPCTGRKLES